MCRLILIAVVALFGNIQVLISQVSESGTLEATIDTLRKVMVDPDSFLLASLASDDLVYVHSSGTIRDKQGFIDEFVKGWTMLSGVTILDQVIRISGDIGIVRHRMIGEVDKINQPPQFDIIILMVWRKENGQWKLLARQAARTP